MWAFVVFFGVAFVAVAVAIPLALPDAHPAADIRTEVVARDSSHCLLGESWDREIGACAPRFKAPLAFSSAIMDNTRTPCDPSFYTMMCGGWMRQHTNENRAFTYAARRVHARIKRLVHTSQALSAAYTSCIGRTTRAALREAALHYKHSFSRYVDPLRTHADLPRVLGRMARSGLTVPLRLSMERHPLEARVVPYLDYDNVPDELLDEGRLYALMQRTRALTGLNVNQEEHLILGALDVARGLKALRSFHIERVASMHSYISSGRLRHDMLRWGDVPEHWTVRSDSGHAPVRGWDIWLQELGGAQLRFAQNQTVWMPDAAYVKRLLGGVLKRYTVLQWRSWLTLSVIWNEHLAEPEMPENAYMQRWHAAGPVSVPRASARVVRNETSEEHCVRVAQHLVPGLVARAYLDTYMSNRTQETVQIRDMVTGVLAELRQMVRASTWLSGADRAVLVDKLQHTLVRVAEPNGVWSAEPYAASLDPHRFEHNVAMTRAYRVQRQLELWHAAAREQPQWDREAMARFLSPLTAVNAYYSGPSNTITILAGIMQHPFYNARYGVVSKYAILGSVIGHELSHALDPHGLHWDARGSYALDGILSAAGMMAFHSRVQCVVREYGPAPAECESPAVEYGNTTLGEDLADQTGIRAAYRALRTAHPDLPMGDLQHFFMVLSQAFCESYDQAHRCEAVANDVHATALFRIDRTMRNMPEFHSVMGCGPGHAMWRAENATCQVYAI